MALFHGGLKNKYFFQPQKPSFESKRPKKSRNEDGEESGHRKKRRFDNNASNFDSKTQMSEEEKEKIRLMIDAEPDVRSSFSFQISLIT